MFEPPALARWGGEGGLNAGEHCGIRFATQGVRHLDAGCLHAAQRQGSPGETRDNGPALVPHQVVVGGGASAPEQPV